MEGFVLDQPKLILPDSNIIVKKRDTLGPTYLAFKGFFSFACLTRPPDFSLALEFNKIERLKVAAVEEAKD